jgi:hypothetical protein
MVLHEKFVDAQDHTRDVLDQCQATHQEQEASGKPR